MKFLNLFTIFALLFSGNVIGQSYNNNTQRKDMPRQERNAQDGRIQQRNQEQQRPSYGQDEYDSRYGEGVRRDKQSRGKNWKEKKRQRKHKDYNKQYKDNQSDRGGH